MPVKERLYLVQDRSNETADRNGKLSEIPRSRIYNNLLTERLKIIPALQWPHFVRFCRNPFQTRSNILLLYRLDRQKILMI